ncbi:nitroreductase [Hyalangium minutum]|uniref:Oxygen-insensitive NADPH nitroreductase n=1 Tax=Hyalangium minutum TaxID=394096 RepID=A0A085W8D8_9BACT|nr:nitroreductase [Hyalangium minutum]KFE63951.1 Oxygen-insensitive NADPH nitroreductase [Hyalangium minutum]
MFDFENLVRNRRSIRRFLPTPIPHELLSEALALAQFAPSNSNIQPWRLFLAEGDCIERLREALREEVQTNPRELAPLPPSFRSYRRELGAIVYGSMGIARDDDAGRAQASLRNYDFFGAPMVGILCMHKELGLTDAVGVGMYLQTLVLGLTARGIGTCVQAALTTYPEAIRRVLAIPEEQAILCGLSLGYADPDFPTNHLRVPKQPVENNVSIQGRPVLPAH